MREWKERENIETGYSRSVTKAIQRKVGLEFQVMGNRKKILMKNGKECGHGIELKKEVGYKITADMGDYEYVTDPVDERSEDEIRRLEEACSDMAVKHRGLWRELKPDWSKTRDRKAGYWPYFINRRQFWLPQPTVNSAHPQATVGIRVDKLGTFVEKYIEKAKKAPGLSYLSNGGTKKKLKAQQDSLLSTTLEQQSQYKARDADVTDAEAGFLSILAAMIQGMYGYYKEKEEYPINAKSAMPLMPRTSLYDVFLKLSSEEREKIAAVLGNYNAVPRTHLADFISNIPSARMIGGEIKVDDVSPENILNIIIAAETPDDEGGVPKIVTLRQWLSGLPDIGRTSPIISSDILARNFNAVSELFGERTGAYRLYAGMSRSTDIGYDEDSSGTLERVEGMLIEIRNMQRNVPVEKWKDVAREVAELTCLVNTGELPKGTQQPRQSQSERLPPLNVQASAHSAAQVTGLRSSVRHAPVRLPRVALGQPPQPRVAQPRPPQQTRVPSTRPVRLPRVVQTRLPRLPNVHCNMVNLDGTLLPPLGNGQGQNRR
ncbi:hypothetical protein D7V86_01640 [bacterium D16-51]|nr:hypothetical protein D7V96_01070 [bacterium D16-59]RKI62503.1 hypothetical protein D7V86_01640 [bacterium D16-51]